MTRMRTDKTPRTAGVAHLQWVYDFEDELRGWYRRGESIARIAAVYGLSEETVFAIVAEGSHA